MAASKKDITNLKFGKLVALKPIGVKDRKQVWLCSCDCGNFTEVRISSLTTGSTTSCGCLSKKYFIDLTGKVFNNLTVIKHLGQNNNKNNIYEVLCKCGKIFISEGSDVKTGKIKSCGCKRFAKSQKLSIKNAKDIFLKRIYMDYSNKAKIRNYIFDLSLEKFTELIFQNCYYCGIEPMNIRKKKYVNREEILIINGIDRMDNTKGYTLENSATCCSICNQAKHTLTKESFLQWINRVSSFQKKADK